jgi:hypothetical protein
LMCTTYLPMSLTCAGTSTWYDSANGRFLYFQGTNGMGDGAGRAPTWSACDPETWGITHSHSLRKTRASIASDYSISRASFRRVAR